MRKARASYEGSGYEALIDEETGALAAVTGGEARALKSDGFSPQNKKKPSPNKSPLKRSNSDPNLGSTKLMPHSLSSPDKFERASGGGGHHPGLKGFPHPAKGGLMAVAKEALSSKVSVEHHAREEELEDWEVDHNCFLSYRLMMREVTRRHGSNSWRVHVVNTLHSPFANTTLIVLLLLDVTVVFAELFLEGVYPGCEIIKRDAVSCCAAAAGPSFHPIEHIVNAATDDWATTMSAPSLFDDHADAAHRMLSSSSAGACGAGLDVFAMNGVYCDPHHHEWVHKLETSFSLITVCILGVFELELLLLLSALGPRLFFRSLLHIFDLFVISSSFGLQVYIYLMRAKADAQEHAEAAAHGSSLHAPDDAYISDLSSHGVAATIQSTVQGLLLNATSTMLQAGQELLTQVDFHHSADLVANASRSLLRMAETQAGQEAIDDIQGLILFSRCWRFVRVGHGIATSINDIVRQRQQKLHETVKEMQQALRELEHEISAQARTAAHQIAHAAPSACPTALEHRTSMSLSAPDDKPRPLHGAAGHHNVPTTASKLQQLKEQHDVGHSLHKVHEVLEKMEKQSEY